MSLALDHLSPTEQDEAAAALEVVAKGIEANPLLAWHPHPKQAIFLAAKTDIKAFFGGNQSGKTTSGLVDDTIQAVDREILPPWLEGYKKWDPPFHCRIVVPDLSYTLEGVVIPKLREIIPRSQFVGGSFDHAYDKQRRMLHFKNGSWFQFMTFEQDVDKFGGATIHRCLSEDTRILKRGGWAGPDEVGIGDEILTYDTASGHYVWNRVKRMYEGRADRIIRLRSRNNFEALVTADHRWWVFNKKTGRSYFTTTTDLKKSEQLIVGSSSGPAETEETYPDDLVALVGWTITDGWVQKSNVTIAQSLSANAAKCETIGALVGGRGSEADIPYRGYGVGVMRHFRLTGQLRKDVKEVVGLGKALPLSFIDALSTRQREILLGAIIDGDGCRNYESGRWSVTSKNEQHQEAIVYLATLLGWRTSIRPHPLGWSMVLAKSRGGRYDYNRVSVDSLEIEEVDYDGRVWCPTTDAGTVVALQNGATFVTGNCHYDEEPPEAIRKECRLRLMKFAGDEVFTMTPLMGMTYTFDAIYERRHEAHITVVSVDMDDNPYLSEHAKQLALEGLSEQERRARKEGRFVHFAGLVFDELDESKHLVDDPSPEHIQGQDIVVGIDPGVRWTGIVFNAFDSENECLSFDELLLTNETIETVANAIKGKLKDWRIDPEEVLYVIDPSARNRQQVNAENIESEFARFEIFCMHGYNDVEAGILQMKRRLQAGSWTIARRCQELIRQMGRYRIDNSNPSKFAVVKVDDHAVDAQRYALTSRAWGGVEPETRKRRNRWNESFPPPRRGGYDGPSTGAMT